MKRSTAIIEISDADRNIDYTLNVAYDWLQEGAVEHPTVTEIVSATVWFGDYGAGLDFRDEGHERHIREHIEEKYHDEIVAEIVEFHAAQYLSGDES